VFRHRSFRSKLVELFLMLALMALSLEERGTLYLFLYPCPLFLIHSSYSSRQPWQSIQVSYCLPRGKSTGSIIQLLLRVCVMLACELVLSWLFNPLVASRSYNSLWYLNPSWLGYPYSFEPLGLHPTAELPAYQESSTPAAKLMCASSI
jgi:hypothetical protein